METLCTPWPGRINVDGYGTIGKDLAHRRVWIESRGPIPEGMTLDHMCHDPEVCDMKSECPHRRCVNLDHLAMVTAAQNRERVAPRRKTHCLRGHALEGENLKLYSGLRHCATCRRDLLRERRAIAKVKGCRARGHERDEQVGADGRRFCVICITDNAVKATTARWQPVT